MKKINNSLFYKTIKTTIGKIYLYSDGTNLIALDFEKNAKYHDAIESKQLDIFLNTEVQLQEYLTGKRKKFNLKINPSGTEFQRSAWNTLMKIPFGKVLSYGEQAKLMNKPNAQRATGSANGKNPIPIIIPCHRIITSDKKLGGYSGDILLKEKLLKIEGHQVNDGRVY
jgi:methylated-DNA-[protein]-cysteine S-methyltransferase